MKEDVKYSESGDRNLQTIGRSDNFCDWMYSEIKPFLHGNILEIGSGIGTYSQRVTRDFPGQQIVLSDLDTEYVRSLGNEFADRENVRSLRLDLMDKNGFEAIDVPFDVVVSADEV